MQTHTSPISIEAVAQQFALWRQAKTSKFNPTPDNLKILVKQLAVHYTTSQIIRHVNISRTLLKALLSKDNNIQPNVDFIPFQINNKTNPLNSHNASGYNTQGVSIDTTIHFKHRQSICHIIKPNGNKLIIETQDLKSIIQAFLCSS